MRTYSGATQRKKITVLTEDSVGRWFLNKILSYQKKGQYFDLNLLDMSVGWTEIIKLIKNDFSYYRNHLVILDPDINSADSYNQLENSLKGTPYNLRKKDSNILLLPGDKNIEKIFWDYLYSLKEDHKLFYEPSIDINGVSKATLLEHGPSSDQYREFNSEKKKIKMWFEQNEWICDIAFNFWIEESENQEKIAHFINSFINSYNIIYNRMQ